MNNKKFWICGKHTVLEAIHNDKREIFKILLSEKNRCSLKNLEKKKKLINFTDDKFISKTIQNNTIAHQGYAALVSSIINKIDISDIIKFNTLIALDQVTDSRNIGSIIRTCAAFNADAIIVKDRNFKEESLSLNKTACGALEKINIIKVPNIKYLLQTLKQKDFKIISFSSNVKNIISQKTFAKKNVLIFGSEEYGISKILLDNSDEIVKIDTSNYESLNVSNSVSAVLSIFQFLKSSGK